MGDGIEVRPEESAPGSSNNAFSAENAVRSGGLLRQGK